MKIKAVVIFFLGALILLLSLIISRPSKCIIFSSKQTIRPEESSSDHSTQRILLFSKEINASPTIQGNRLEFLVELKNNSERKITDVNINSGCSCSIINIKKNCLEPNGTTQAVVSIDTARKNGILMNTYVMQFHYDDKRYIDSFVIKVPIKTPGKLNALPSLVSLDRSKSSEFKQVITIKVIEPDPERKISIVSIHVPNWTTYVLKELENNKTWELNITGNLPSRPGRHMDSIIVKTNSTLFSELLIPLIVENNP